MSLRLVDLAILAGALIDLDGMNPALVHALATALHTVLTAPPEVAQTTQHLDESIASARGKRGAVLPTCRSVVQWLKGRVSNALTVMVEGFKSWLRERLS